LPYEFGGTGFSLEIARSIYMIKKREASLNLSSRDSIFKQIIPKGNGILSITLHNVELND
jgi:hypothetical protein